MSTRSLRCAIYTRKSSEEGLDMAFNSLDAQREACLDYIKSQRHQGWAALPDKYDDGGFSGGNTDRPGLQRLLAEIEAGRVDIVVVYKVDRLSRSLADFARLMQLFDEHRVSFVSVTQQFSTTSSMGRLTLNMLLSVAQFEREVAGERIRDKIAATMKKGIWVCGQPPLGYRLPRADLGELADRVLRIVPEEAKTIRAIFDGYLKLGSFTAVAQRLNAAGHTTKHWTSTRGKSHGGRPLSSAAVYDYLTNPIYIGKITHTRRLPAENGSGAQRCQTDLYDGLHEPIIPRDLWDKVHAKMARPGRDSITRWTHTHLLKGKLRTSDDWAISPSYTRKRRGNGPGSCIGYYVSQKALKHGFKICEIKSINARLLDDLVRGLLMDFMRVSSGLQLPVEEPSIRDHWIRCVLTGVKLAPNLLTIELDLSKLEDSASELPRADPHTPAACCFTPEVIEQGRTIVLKLAIQIKKLDGRRMLLAPDGQDLLATSGEPGNPSPRAALVRAIARAYHFRREILESGLSIKALAECERIGETRIHTLLRLTNLGPDVLRATLTGTLRPRISLRALLHAAQSLDWQRQKIALRMV